MKKKIAGLGLRILVAVILVGTGFFTATAARAETVVFEAENFIEQGDGFWNTKYLKSRPPGLYLYMGELIKTNGKRYVEQVGGKFLKEEL